jgi:hypothetical protein
MVSVGSDGRELTNGCKCGVPHCIHAQSAYDEINTTAALAKFITAPAPKKPASLFESANRFADVPIAI